MCVHARARVCGLFQSAFVALQQTPAESREKVLTTVKEVGLRKVLSGLIVRGQSPEEKTDAVEGCLYSWWGIWQKKQ